MVAFFLKKKSAWTQSTEHDTSPLHFVVVVVGFDFTAVYGGNGDDVDLVVSIGTSIHQQTTSYTDNHN